MHKTPEITRLIHDNFWIVLSFAFARPVISKVVDREFLGEWKYLNKTIHERGEIRADRALLEMATQLRVLDDSEGLNEAFKRQSGNPLGEVIQSDGTTTELHFRDMTNKVMHAAEFRWDLSSPDRPAVICIPHDQERWKEARLEIVSLMSYIGLLMH